jgi:hypothetical protein
MYRDVRIIARSASNCGRAFPEHCNPMRNYFSCFRETQPNCHHALLLCLEPHSVCVPSASGLGRLPAGAAQNSYRFLMVGGFWLAPVLLRSDK